MKLVPLNLGHARGIFSYLKTIHESPDIFFERPKSLKEVRDYIKKLHHDGVIAHVLLDDRNKPKGIITFKPIIVCDMYQIGFYFATSVRGRGLGKFILAACDGLNRYDIVATPYSDNMKCKSILSKLGFIYHHTDGNIDYYKKPRL